MRTLVFLLSSIIFISCNDESNIASVNSIPNSNKGSIKYSLSKPYEIDFHVCGSSYSILYKNDVPIDSALMHSGVFFIATDSALYVQVRSAEPMFPEEANTTKSNDIVGTVTALIIYDGNHFNVIKPPLFNEAFSAFTYKDYYIYYWGHESDDSSLHTFACRYHILTKAFSKILLTDDIGGTDYMGAFVPPQSKDGKIEFQYHPNTWLIDQNFDKLTEKEEVDSVVNTIL